MASNHTNTDELKTNVTTTLKDTWSIRPCEVYKDEYDDCTSIKARFHQYFVHGESVDCSQWQRDFENCTRYEKSDKNDVASGEAVIKSEAERREARMKAHYGNTTWKHRSSPPSDWAKPLPDWFAKRNENSFLELKQMELDGRAPVQEEVKSYCAIM